ncbi:MAG: FAD-dependent oxidoreductase, partial [Actinobacteria bacterium]|nr:FAD-dependent oxidoreductase [Actinomycetota bacterium]
MNEAIGALKEIFGDARVDTNVDRYLNDITEAPRGQADIVVQPRTADEVVAAMGLAHAHGLPVTPVVAGYNVAGLAIPRNGGIVLDLTLMDRIIEVNHDAMYVVVEPGVTFGQLKAHLD